MLTFNVPRRIVSSASQECTLVLGIGKTHFTDFCDLERSRREHLHNVDRDRRRELCILIDSKLVAEAQKKACGRQRLESHELHVGWQSVCKAGHVDHCGYTTHPSFSME